MPLSQAARLLAEARAALAASAEGEARLATALTTARAEADKGAEHAARAACFEREAGALRGALEAEAARRARADADAAALRRALERENTRAEDLAQRSSEGEAAAAVARVDAAAARTACEGALEGEAAAVASLASLSRAMAEAKRAAAMEARAEQREREARRLEEAAAAVVAAGADAEAEADARAGACVDDGDADESLQTLNVPTPAEVTSPADVCAPPPSSEAPAAIVGTITAPALNPSTAEDAADIRIVECTLSAAPVPAAERLVRDAVDAAAPASSLLLKKTELCDAAAQTPAHASVQTDCANADADADEVDEGVEAARGEDGDDVQEEPQRPSTPPPQPSSPPASAALPPPNDAFAAERHRLEVQAYAYYCRWVVELQRQHPDVDIPPYRSPYDEPGALHAVTTAAPMVAADGAALP